jgi:hypothetical protein
LNGNVISGNNLDGVLIESGAINTLIDGNFIGTVMTGTVAIANQKNGIEISNTNNNLVGSRGQNLISGNTLPGVLITGASAHDNQVVTNLIGTTINGNAPLVNIVNIGVQIAQGANKNTIGNFNGGGNVISGNQTGISIAVANTNANKVYGNLIGTDSSGTVKVANGTGVVLGSGALNNTIGGSNLVNMVNVPLNVISGNGTGVWVSDTSATTNTIQYNWIGVDKTGNVKLGNTTNGIEIEGSGTIILRGCY